MFMGEYNHTIDAKGRLIIPAKFREELGEAFVITNGNDGCLNIYTKEAWETFLEKLLLLPGNEDKRKMVRALVSQADSVELDKQGRILIPNTLRERAGLIKDVVLAGAIDKIEVWDKSNWETATGDTDIDDIAERLADLGLNI
ncbi:MAG: division/cell wall cluster transcriptional repressor MraZ [Lachnospiraceae bacterium]|nr:division/cell wall cluster transcriptional repressor MraZ [Lachnospiraceae bacterium]MBR5766391.1 division/cell wall cluster transcriptional repressor MraZ [Lachnospiraceae bacterium]MBR6485474.1 division/cell wall cluster transcriptional repressor MraZ [Lachnospiraceae bacterium]